MSSVPVRLDRLQVGLVAWVRACVPTATVCWSKTGMPNEAGSAQQITLRMLTGPDDEELGGSSCSRAVLPLSAIWRVLPAALDAEGASVALAASGLRWETTIGADPTLESIRDAMLAAITAGEVEGESLISATFTAIDLDPDDEEDDIDGGEILIEAITLGDLYKVAALSTDPGLVELEVVTQQAGSVTTTDVRTLVEVQAWTRDVTPRGGASSVLSPIKMRGKAPAAKDVLDRFGLALTGGGPERIINLDALSGPRWASRAAFSLYVSQIAIHAEPQGAIERVRGTLVGTRGATAVSVSIDTEPPE